MAGDMKAQDVQDRKAEFGINLSVIVQALILAAIIGFGKFIVGGLSDLNDNVKELTQEMASINTITSLNASEIKHNAIGINHNAEDVEKLRLTLEDHIKAFPHYIDK